MVQASRQRGRFGLIDWRWPCCAAILLLAALLPAGLGLEEAVVHAAPEDGPGASAAHWRSGGTDGIKVQGLSCLRVHPKRRDVLWAHVHGMGPARSTDGGATWEVRLDGVADKDRPGLRSSVRISLDPGDANIMYLTIDGQIYRSADAGGVWTSITSGALASLSWDKFRNTHLSWEVRVDPKKGPRLVVGTRNDGDHHGGLFESTNSGKSFEEIAGSAQSDTGLGNDTFLVRLSPSSDKFLTVAGRRNVWYSDTRGRSFERNDPGGAGIHDIRGLSEFSGKVLFLADARGVWRSKDSGKRWEKKPVVAGDCLGVFLDPHSRKRVYAVFADRGVLISVDGRNAKWAPFGVIASADDKADPTPAGLQAAMIREVYVHPRDKKTLLLASHSSGLYASTDGGKTIVPVKAPEDARVGTSIPATMPPMAFASIHRTRGGAHLAVGDDGCVYRSGDRGASWSRRGPLGLAPRGLVPDRMAKSWLAFGSKLLASGDDGDTWSVLWPPAGAKDADINFEERVIGVDRGAPGTDRDGNPTSGALRILLERSGAILTSEDDGLTWFETKGPRFPSSQTWAAAMAVNPANRKHIVVAARTTRQAWNARDENGGIYQSWDGGASWQDITGFLRPVTADDADARTAKARWNRPSFLAVDVLSGMILYGAAGRGLFMRPIVDPKAKEKAKTNPRWFDITPAGPANPTVTAAAVGLTPDKTTSLLSVQVRGALDESAIAAINGTALKTLHAALAAAGDDAARKAARDASPWTKMPSPGARVFFSSLYADPQLPGRLIGTERETDKGVLIYEIPGSSPEAPKKDEPKEDEPKKVEIVPVPPQAPPPEGMRAFTAGLDKTWRVWAVDKGTSTTQIVGHENQILCIQLSPDEAYVVTGSDDRTLRFWSAANTKEVGRVTTDGSVIDLAFDDDSTFLYAAAGSTQSVLQIDLATQKIVKTFAGHSGSVLCVATSEDTQRAYSGGEDHVVIVWDTKKGTEVNSIIVGAPVIALAIAEDGSKIYAAGRDKSLVVFDAAGKPVARLDGLAAPVSELALDPSGEILYATAPDGVLAVDTKTMTVGVTHAAPESGGITCLALSSDGKWVLAGDARGGFWMWAKGQAVAYRGRVQEHEGAVHGIAMTPEETEDVAAVPPPKDEPAKKGDVPAKKGDVPAKKGDVPAKKGDVPAPKDAPKKDDVEPVPKDG